MHPTQMTLGAQGKEVGCVSCPLPFLLHSWEESKGEEQSSQRGTKRKQSSQRGRLAGHYAVDMSLSVCGLALCSSAQRITEICSWLV